MEIFLSILLFIVLAWGWVCYFKFASTKKDLTAAKNRISFLEEEDKRRKENFEKRTVANFPVGQKVIVRSNEKDRIWHGTVVRHEQIGSSWLPVVVKTGQKKEWLCMGAMAYYTDARWKALIKLNAREQWQVMTRYV